MKWLSFSPVLYKLQILMLINTDITHSSYISYVWFIVHCLAMSHCCYNPVIYCYMNGRFRLGFFQILFFVPGIRHCCCINAYPRDRSTSLRTGIALTGNFFFYYYSCSNRSILVTLNTMKKNNLFFSHSFVESGIVIIGHLIFIISYNKHRIG